MTTALYRRYRPETFAEVIGQEHVTAPLMQALRSGRVNHAYLFSGPRGCGKTTSARILARTLNCARNTPENPIDTPCGECDSCVELARGGPGSLDVVEIDAASHNGVDDARDLRERATFAPARDRYKIFILDEAHMVTPQGFNALLKIVEEPPPHIKFVFATTEPDKVIGTIRSRTHHYPFRLVPPDVLGPYLEQLCAAEGIELGGGVVPLVTRAGGGSVRDSLSVLDQLIAGASGGTVEYDTAVGLLGFTHATLLDDVVDALAARDGASIFRVVDQVVATGHEPRRFVEDVLERLRDLIVIAVSGDEAEVVLRGLPTDQLERMRAQASRLGVAELSRAADLVNAALTEMTGATSPRLHLELLCARLLLPGADDGAAGLAARLDRLERGVVPVGATAGTVAQGGVAAGAVPSGQASGGTPGTSDGSASSSVASSASVPGGLSGAAAARAALLASRRPAEPGAPAEPAARPAAAPSSAQAQAPASSGAPSPSAPADDPAPSSEPQAPTVSETEPAPTPAFGTEPVPAFGTEPTREPTPTRERERGAEPPTEPGDGAGLPAAQVPSPDVEAPARSVEQPTSGSASAPDSADRSSAEQPTAEAPAAEAAAPSGGVTTETVRRRWDEVLANLGRVTQTLVSQNAQVVTLDGGVLRLGFAAAGIARTFSQPRHVGAVEEALYQTLGVRARVEAIVGDAGTPGGTPGGAGGAPGAGPRGAGGPAGTGPAAPTSAAPGESRPDGRGETSRPGTGSRSEAAPSGGVASSTVSTSGGVASWTAAAPGVASGQSGQSGPAAGTAVAPSSPGGGLALAERPVPAPDAAPSATTPGATTPGATTQGAAVSDAADAAWLAGVPLAEPADPAHAPEPPPEPWPTEPDPAGDPGETTALSTSARSAGPAPGSQAPAGQPAAPAAGPHVRETPRQAAERQVRESQARSQQRTVPVPNAAQDADYAEYDDSTDDDQAAAAPGLAGVPLVVKVLGGTVIEEFSDQG
ncbi:DNA polymerase III subunit gamma and tau [Isoptericola sp. NEAU-Y5]|uniref:DNA-directed DNA polymerase n=1 Tax=Isoptericola luteus TaxID=2879484 RepID=A0ABS7ZH33_9MICO|nr:DNA polymerase III subunit gamma and tau [Isoptericola sp. NEAU-Y5]MCA5894344.1 DNA polymerase III subunit gamma and tau [Isoptericola sp. NEAU-Y5]